MKPNQSAEHDARKALLIEHQYFGGLNSEEMALVSRMYSSSIDRELRFSRARLKAYLTENSPQQFIVSKRCLIAGFCYGSRHYK